MVVIAVVVPLLLLFTAVLVELAGRGRLRRNRIAGIRTRATMRSDTAWSAAHRSAAPTVWIGFAVSAVAGIVALVSDGTLSLVCGVTVVVAFFATAAASLIQAGRAGAAAS
ncbi:SdpI family protein [Microbacterium oxydans]|uniref:SdpI family protein n=1 Tax=Microbacterium oxydans TaxID=82380 RepID=UPI00226B4C55|nr:SdpI family protein [Microbacterium oxydans]WAA65789.1 SdpI family protein [Microbacterium oxydans]